MPKCKTIRFDGKKLKYELYQAGTTVSKASVDLGYSKGRLSQMISKGVMPLTTMRLITYKYGILYESIQPDVNIKEEQTENNNEEKMYQLIYKAVYNAFKDVLEGDNGK